MNSLSKLKEKNETLSRELADSCRQYVELTFGWQDLKKKFDLLDLTFKKYIMSSEGVNLVEAEEKIDILMKKTQEPVQLEMDFPIKMENDF